MSNIFNPQIKHPELENLEDKYELVTALWGGTESMQDAGTKYLPKEPGEETNNYSRRLNQSVLDPAYEEAVNEATSKIISGDFDILQISPLLQPILEDIDEDSNNIEMFAQEATQSAFHYGCSYILVDYPVMNENATLADEQAAGAQPYWVLLNAPQVLEASPVKQGGKNILGVFRFAEREAFRTDEFSVAYRDRVKEFRLFEGTVIYRVFIKQEGQWTLQDEGPLLGMTEIPVVPMYTNKVGYFMGSPYFYDLAAENALNWRITSDYQNILHITSVPMMVITGISPNFDDNGLKQEVVISPNTVLEFTNPDTKVEWLEATGSATDSSRQAIIDSKEKMNNMSLSMLSDDPNAQTATGNMLESEESRSVLSVLSTSVAKALTKAIDLSYQYLGLQNPGSEVVLTVKAPTEVVAENEFNSTDTNTQDTE